jgi:quinol monooxygenase YgiN
MIFVVGSFRLPPAALDAARPAMARVIAATRAEDGCQAYSYAEDLVDPGLIRVSECWDSREHLAAHFETAHMRQWQQERSQLGLSERDIRLIEAGAVEIL